MKVVCVGDKQLFGGAMIRIPGMIMVGSGDRNAGKTEFACSLIRKFDSQTDVIGIKVTAIADPRSGCPRGEDGCGVCVTLEDDYCIIKETLSKSDKDTCRMLAAGASQVFWLRVLKPHLAEGIKALLDIIGDDAISVCESNSLRQVVEPALFFMLKGKTGSTHKSSAKAVSHYADREVVFDGNDFDLSLDEIELVGGGWACKMRATAIIMAGGQSKRMGRDKSMLPINGKPAIEHIFEQLRPHFDRILISSNDKDTHHFLGADVVADEVTGKGPLMGIASALKVSKTEVNFVIACDIPHVDMGLVRQMVRQSRDFDAVIPRSASTRYEPLFAVYKKSIVDVLDKALASGNYRIIDALNDCRVNYLDPADGRDFRNLNTMNDYEEFCRG